MSHQEKRSYLSIIATIGLCAAYCLYTFPKLVGNDALQFELAFWAKAFLIFIPIAIVVRIIFEILLSIGNTISSEIHKSHNDDPSFTDERDKLIDLKSGRAAQYIVVFGFLVAMATLVFRIPPYIMFNIMYFSINIGEIAENIFRIHFYRSGL